MAKNRLKLIADEKFRADVEALWLLPNADWDEYESKFLLDQKLRPSDYSFSDQQRWFLDRLKYFSASFSHYSEISVKDLLEIAYANRFELSNEHEDDARGFVEKIYRQQPKELKRRRLIRLANICRRFERISRDALDKPYEPPADSEQTDAA